MRIGGRAISWKRVTLYTLGILALLFLLIQAIPYGRDHSNPPVTKEPVWDSPQTRAFAREACFDCHSNETKWPWYTNIAPVSWLVQSDVDEGRAALNFSEWDTPQETDEIVEAVREGEMPPWYYTLMPNHSGARLSSSEKDAFLNGLAATLAPSASEHEGEDD